MCERLKLCKSEGDIPSASSITNSPFNMPIESHSYYSPISSSNSPYHNNMALNSNFNQSDMMRREHIDHQLLDMNFNYNSPVPQNTGPSLESTPSIYGSRVFGGNTIINKNPSHSSSSTFNSTSPISLSPELPINSNHLDEDLVRMFGKKLIMEFVESTFKNESNLYGSGRNVLSPFLCSSVMNGALNSQNDIKRFVAVNLRCIRQIVSDFICVDTTFFIKPEHALPSSMIINLSGISTRDPALSQLGPLSDKPLLRITIISHPAPIICITPSR